MGRLKASGFHCPKCNRWGPDKVYGKGRIEAWFKVEGKLYRYCQTCTDATYAELEVRLGKEGKKVKTAHVPNPPQVIISTDASDYVELKLEAPTAENVPKDLIARQ